MLEVNPEILRSFEQHLVPWKPEKSGRKYRLLGYGEISSIFALDTLPGKAIKRMPLFAGRVQAEKYEEQYHLYCKHLKTAGLNLPEDRTVIVEIPGRPVVLYIIQQELIPEGFGHKIIHHRKTDQVKEFVEKVFTMIDRVWQYNTRVKPGLELSLDGQLSNWVESDGTLYFVDTSTPLFRIDGKEQLDPELLLRSAPGFLRWILRAFFLDDVMNRYYNRRQVFVDLAANLYKEQKPELIPDVLELANFYLPKDQDPLTIREIDKYYREDKMIWTLFLAFRRFDRWMSTRIFGKRYEFILPGKIKR